MERGECYKLKNKRKTTERLVGRNRPGVDNDSSQKNRPGLENFTLRGTPRTKAGSAQKQLEVNSLLPSESVPIVRVYSGEELTHGLHCLPPLSRPPPLLPECSARGYI